MSQPEPEKIICFAGDNYRFSNPHSRYHLMHALHRAGHPILWVNSIGMNMPSVSKKGFTKRVWNKLRSWVSSLYTPQQDFHVFTPIALPLFGNKAVESLNNRWIQWQIRLVCRRTGFTDPLIFASIPSFAPIVAKLPNRGLIYYYSDKYDAYRDISAKDTIQQYDRLLFDSAHAVFCAAERVFEGLKDSRPHVHYLPHAVDVAHFTVDESPMPLPAAMQNIPSPRVGYFGSLTDSNDLDVIEHAARQRPDHQFVLIGRVLGDYSALQRLPNVHLLGFIPYQELPRYARHFNAAFMAWKMTEWIRYCNPLKTKEYLCLGLPVASIRIQELEKSFSEHIYFFDDGPTFVDALDQALAEDSPEKRRLRKEAAADYSWDHTVANMMTLFREAVAHEPAE